jgi:hypothetical protein
MVGPCLKKRIERTDCRADGYPSKYKNNNYAAYCTSGRIIMIAIGFNRTNLLVTFIVKIHYFSEKMPFEEIRN